MKHRNSHKNAQREKVAFLSSGITSLTSKHTCQIIEDLDNHIKAVEKQIDELIQIDKLPDSS